MIMAIADPPLRDHDLCQSRNTYLPATKLALFARRFPNLCVVSCALMIAGCARNTAQRELSPAIPEVKVATHVTAPAHVTHPSHRRKQNHHHLQYAEPPRIRRPDPALLAPQPEPNCEFNRPDLKTVDPDQWARLKVEYERQCYEDAEKEARDRLTLLQASSTCEIEPAGGQRTVTPQHAQP
jgi:hypothetical protein